MAKKSEWREYRPKFASARIDGTPESNVISLEIRALSNGALTALVAAGNASGFERPSNLTSGEEATLSPGVILSRQRAFAGWGAAAVGAVMGGGPPPEMVARSIRNIRGVAETDPVEFLMFGDAELVSEILAALYEITNGGNEKNSERLLV